MTGKLLIECSHCGLIIPRARVHTHEKIGWISNSSTIALISISDGRFSKRLAASNILGRSCISPAVIRKLFGKPNDQCTDLSMAS